MGCVVANDLSDTNSSAGGKIVRDFFDHSIATIKDVCLTVCALSITVILAAITVAMVLLALFA